MIPNCINLVLVSSLLVNALSRQKDILGQINLHHTTSDNSNAGDGFLVTLLADENEKHLDLDAVHNQESALSVAMWSNVRFLLFIICFQIPEAMGCALVFQGGELGKYTFFMHEAHWLRKRQSLGKCSSDVWWTLNFLQFNSGSKGYAGRSSGRDAIEAFHEPRECNH